MTRVGWLAIPVCAGALLLGAGPSPLVAAAAADVSAPAAAVATPPSASPASAAPASAPALSTAAPDPDGAPAASAAPASPAAAVQPDGATLDELLGRPSEDAPPSERCIRMSSIDTTDVLNPHMIVFKDHREHVYINQMPVECPGLEPRSKVAYISRGDDRLCQLDGIRVLHYGGIGIDGGDIINPGPACMLGKFEPITQDQLDVLQERFTPHGKSILRRIFD